MTELSPTARLARGRGRGWRKAGSSGAAPRRARALANAATLPVDNPYCSCIRDQHQDEQEHVVGGTKEMVHPCLIYLHLISLVAQVQHQDEQDHVVGDGGPRPYSCNPLWRTPAAAVSEHVFAGRQRRLRRRCQALGRAGAGAGESSAVLLVPSLHPY